MGAAAVFVGSRLGNSVVVSGRACLGRVEGGEGTGCGGLGAGCGCRLGGWVVAGSGGGKGWWWCWRGGGGEELDFFSEKGTCDGGDGGG